MIVPEMIFEQAQLFETDVDILRNRFVAFYYLHPDQI